VPNWFFWRKLKKGKKPYTNGRVGKNKNGDPNEGRSVVITGEKKSVKEHLFTITSGGGGEENGEWR